MPTLTIELPEDAYQMAINLPVAERQRIVANAFATAINGTDDAAIRLPAADLAAIGQGLADSDAGREQPSADVFAEMRERFGWTKK